MTPQYFEDKPIAQLLGKDIEAKSINDIALGRTLDKIYEYGVSDLFSKIASNAVKTLGISSKIGHLDSTAFATNIEKEKETGDGTVEIRKGHSKDYRPDLNQIALNMIVENKIQNTGQALNIHYLSLTILQTKDLETTRK